MFIFYDFETSSRSLMGQILSYAFVVVDEHYAIQDQLVGTIALNRTQLPEVGAILINRICLSAHQTHSLSEKDAAAQIYNFLDTWTTQTVCTLVGYNSNQFDLSFLRNLLIRYGYNPYYYGRLKNKDLLHYSRHMALQYPDQFRWESSENRQGDSYWMFTLESMAMRYGIISDKQAHDALADVRVCLDLIIALEAEFPSNTLGAFQPFNSHGSTVGQLVQSRVFSQPPTLYSDDVFYLVAMDRRAALLVRLDQYCELESVGSGLSNSVYYRNPNKHYAQLKPIESVPDRYQNDYLSIQKNSVIQSLSIDTYLASLNNDWDIEHQIYAMGFERIPQLHQLIQRLDNDPSKHTALVQELMHQPNEKDRYLIRLFNRYCLNYMKDVPDNYFERYIVPRYVTGEYERNSDEFQSFDSQYSDLLKKLELKSIDDANILNDLKGYYDAFKARYPYASQTTTK
ncbi:hypothetical protein CL648_05015 [bacterium]|nr:hypothetical protein [bacterium]